MALVYEVDLHNDQVSLYVDYTVTPIDAFVLTGIVFCELEEEYMVKNVIRD